MNGPACYVKAAGATEIAIQGKIILHMVVAYSNM